jgi:hypothetical protein
MWIIEIEQLAIAHRLIAYASKLNICNSLAIMAKEENERYKEIFWDFGIVWDIG